MNKLKLVAKDFLFTIQGFCLALLTLIVVMCLLVRVTVFNCNFHRALFLRHNVCVHTYNYINDSIDCFSDRILSNSTSDPLESDLIKVIKSSISLRFVTLNLELMRNELFSYFSGNREFLPDVSFPNINNADVEKISKTMSSPNLKTLKKINASTILLTFGFNNIINILFVIKFVYFLIHQIPLYIFMVTLTIFFINLIFMKSSHSMYILVKRYLIFLGIFSLMTSIGISAVLYYFVTNNMLLEKIPTHFSGMLCNYTINLVIPIVLLLILTTIVSFALILFLSKSSKLFEFTKNISFLSKLEEQNNHLLYPVIFIIIVMCLTYKLHLIYNLIMNNFNNIVCPSEAVVSAFDETIYDIKVTVIDAKTKMPIPGIAVSMSGISKDGIYFSTMAKSNSDGSLTFNANKGHFYLDFVSDLFPPEYVLPRRSRISFDTAKTINVLLKLKSATYVDNKLGSVSIEFLDSTNMPYPNISLCLIPTDNASKNIYSVSNTKGISVFKTKPGNYYVDVLKDNFPLNQYRLPDRFNISIEGGTNKKYVIKLVPF